MRKRNVETWGNEGEKSGVIVVLLARKVGLACGIICLMENQPCRAAGTIRIFVRVCWVVLS